MQSSLKSKITAIFRLIAILACVLIVAVLAINIFMTAYAGRYTYTPEEISSINNADCILVLGCGVYNGEPTPLLADRLQRGVELFQSGVAPKLLMTGDHGQVDYDEVNIMKNYAIQAGVAAEDIFMDHAGFSTYESMCRAKEIFGVEKMIIVTQKYHLSRAIYNARMLGIDAYGVASDYRTFGGQFYRDCREVLARVKDMFVAIIQPDPTYLGEAIPISGDGNVTAG